MSASQVIGMVAEAVVREVFARLDNELDAKGEIVTRGNAILAELVRTELPDRAGAAFDALEEAEKRIRESSGSEVAELDEPGDGEDPYA